MATLVLSTIGGAVGGPVGSMIGSIVGQVIDRELLFKPKGREGPRLTELAVQTSSYDTPIPQLFGTMRVAGSVIWATDLVEHRHRDGGKGRPTVTSYSYSASFAVALSARPVLSVGRIWADGKLLRGAAGDWKANTGFRLHLGHEDQAADPLIASAEGIGLAPAHRGMAYAVFEDLDLVDFGNRIPSLTFEVTADTAPVAIGAVVATVSHGRVAAGEAATPVAGYSAYGGSIRSVIEPLAEAAAAWPVATGTGLTLVAGTGAATEIADLGLSAKGEGGTGVRAVASADSAPRRLTIAHYDATRDYQAGVQRADRPGAGHREARIELPAVIDAGAAKTMAQRALDRADHERERRAVLAGWGALTIAPGARVTIAGEPGVWRVIEARLEAMAVALELVRVAPAAVAVTGTGGRVLGAPDAAAGETVLALFELPPIGDAPISVPRLTIAAAGTEPGWRRAALEISMDGGVRWDAIGASAAPATIGVVETPPGPGPANIADRDGMLVVVLAHGGMALGDADGSALDGGANLALVGDELIQFAGAEPLGEGRWRLNGLWRGRRGTERAIGTQAVGDRFVLVEGAAMVSRDLSRTAIGANAAVRAIGVGDAEPVAETLAVTGRSAVPPAPVHLRATATPDGGATLKWVRRSRSGWGWSDGADVPLGEEAERYRVSMFPTGAAARTIEVTEPVASVTADERAGGPLRIEVRQAGDIGLSPPAEIIINEEL